MKITKILFSLIEEGERLVPKEAGFSFDMNKVV